MKQHTLHAVPGRLTVLAALLAGMSAPAFAVSDNIVISQVYGAGGNGSGATGATLKHDYIELFNRGSTPVSLNGWSVQYASSTGTSWQVTPLTSVTLEPGQYYLVQEAAGAGGTASTVVADKVGSIAMAAGAGKVALVSSTTALTGAAPTGGTVVDFVGYGSANGYEGAGPTPTLGNLLSAYRGNDGCTETDSNSADFATAVPAPRNTLTEKRLCSVAPQKPIVATCPSVLALAQGYAGSAALSATDLDGIVNGATISSGAMAGISLTGFTAAPEEGGVATVNLTAADSLGVGNYPVTVQFSNNQGQTASCPLTVKISGLAAVTKSIPEIQGPGATSPYANSVQTTEGIVTLKVGTGFFLQDLNGDGNPDTSDGIFIYTANSPANVKAGDKVRVTGTVTEYTPAGAARSYTEIKDVTATVVMSAGYTITPTNVVLGDDLSKVEGMLVNFTQPLTINQVEFLGDRGEMTLANGRLEVPTNRYPARTAQAYALAASNAANMIVLDDGIFTTPTTIPYIGQDNTVRAGDTVTGLTGVIDFGAIGGGGAAFKVQPVTAPQISRTNPREDAPVLPAGNVKVASANVLNFFTTFANGTDVEGRTGQGCKIGSTTSASNCRGANNMTEFIRQRDKIVAKLKAIDADVVGLMEIQNNGEYAVTYLTNALNAAIGAPVYAVVPAPAASGTDAIRVAMIYKPSKLTLVGGALSDGDAINNRAPMAQTFTAANGEKFSLIVNHLKSKGSCPSSGADADQGDSQGCWNANRILQAQRLINTFVPQVVSAAGDPDVLLIGDMNSYGMEDPIAVMTNAGFVNQLERFIRPNGMPYSFIFGSNSGYLDHALASAALSPQVAGAAEWHVNADEPTVIDYNLESKPQDLYTALPYRASDHDPVVISLNLQPKFVDVTGSVRLTQQGAAYNRVTLKYVAAVTVTNTSNAPLTGPFQLQLNGLTAGLTLDNASGMHDGAPYVTVNTTLAPGAVINVPLTFSGPARLMVTYTPKFFRGSF
ncbi:hypothetical protein GCM10027277_47980 [Pseudoduganella ginsengisoli]|uniref:ExeM/NucH family extracellular endonuclease n=1 Tax=Pseudoduganella ginsengisoli TaxID=1462440 RepID=A0A6L6Q2B2_9BURK|nr:ExeM/NucH family extracellular endonuclease [Pseudoduganella ginsengisoli]MTW04013.1 ExeM/NucH family extracellular endonuclease [Pseudoduganella ginsengisoli]